jgi:filamentous hemagglutinin
LISNNDLISLLENINENTLTITTETLTNNGRIAANGNLRIDANVLNSTAITSLIKANDIIIVSTTSLENQGSILALNDLTITSNIISSKVINAGRNVSLSASQITNHDSIIAGNKINITATDFLTNNNDILSLVEDLGEIALTINAKTLNNNKRIAANSSITINANAINNNSANSLILSGRDVNLNITNLNNTSGTIESKNILNIRNLTTNNPNAALLLSVSNTGTNISNSGNLKSKNAIDINIGSSNYNIIGKLETDGHIKITAGNIINRANIGAKDYIKFVASGYFTNGINGGNNSNIKIASGTYLDISANGHINNYSILSAKTDLTLKSINGNITNHNGAELIASDVNNAGTSRLILEAINGSINQYSIINGVVANGEHIVSAHNYNNEGEVDVAGNVIMNITNDFNNNAGAAIYAGGDMYLNIGHNLTNKTGAVIYANNNLTIRKYDPTHANYNASNNRINKLDNLSGEIIAYSGDINIASNAINNKRTEIYIQSVRKWRDDYCGCEHEAHYDLHEEGSYSGSLTGEAKIYAGYNININSGYSLASLGATSLTNQSSSIIARNNINLNIGTLNNNSNSFKSYTKFENYWWYGRGNTGHNWQARLDQFAFLNLIEENLPATFKAGSNITANVVNNIGNQDLIKNVPVDPRLNQTPDIVNGIDISTLLETGRVEFSLGGSTTIGKSADASTTNSQLADNSAATGKSANNSATSAQLSDDSATTGKSADNSATSGQLSDDSASTGKSSDASTTNSQLADNSAATGKSTNNSATSAQLSDDSATTGKSADNSATSGQLSDDSASTGKSSDASTTNSQLADNSASTGKSTDDSATTGKSADNSATSGQLANNIKSTGKSADNASTSSNLANDSPTRFGLSNYFDGPDNQGMFTKNPNPNGPLFETRSQFLDQSKFFGSDYFYQKIGLNLTDVATQFEQQSTRLVGDQFFQTQLIEKQLQTITKNSFLLSENETDSNAEIKNLFDNAADEYARLGLDVNGTLTQNQIDSLEKDIIWFETETINGELYVVPKIFLTKATRNRLKNGDGLNTKSTMMAMGDLQLNSGSLNNSGSITGNKVVITANDNITNNNFSEIVATNNLDLTSNNGSIINFSKLKGDGIVSLTAKDKIINTALAKTNDADLLNSGNPAYVSNGMTARTSGNISSTLIETALIEAGMLNINAGNDFNNYGADIATGNIDITAGDDINIETVKIRNGREYRDKGYTSITDTTKNIGSNISAVENIYLIASGYGYDGELATSQENYQIAQEKYNADLVKYSEDLTNYQEGSQSFSSGRLGKFKSPPKKPVKPIFSNFAENNIGSNVNINGSNINAGKDLNIGAADNVSITNAVDSDYSFMQTTKKGSLKTSITKKTDYVETAVSSNLGGENVNVTTGNNIFIQGSNLNSKSNEAIVSGSAGGLSDVGGNTNLVSDGNTTITNATLQEYHHYSKQVSNRGLFKGVTAITSAVQGLAMLSLQVGFNSTNTLAKLVGQEDAAKKVSRGIKEQSRGSQFYTTKTRTINKTDLTNIIASNVSADNDLTITANKATTIVGSNLISGAADNDNNNPNITGKLAINSKDLNIYAAANQKVETVDTRTGTTFSIKNNNVGDATSDFTNSNLTAKNDNFSYNIAGKADIQAKNLDDPILGEPSYLVAIKEQLAPTNISQSNLEIANRHWDETNRELTDAAIATAAVVIVVATIVTAGAAAAAAGAAAGATAVGASTAVAAGATAAGASAAAGATMAAAVTVGASTAVAAGVATVTQAAILATLSTIAVTAGTTAISASMNMEGDMWKQAKGVSKTTWDESTSRDAFESYAIAAATAALTAGLTSGISEALSSTGSSSQAVNGVNNTTNVANGTNNVANTTNAVNNVATTTSNSSSFLSNFGTSLKEAAISNVSSTVVQSTINGDSFGDALEGAAINTVIGAVGNMGAKAIGNAYHGGEMVKNPDGTLARNADGKLIVKAATIGKSTQLALHGVLGCGMAAAGGGDCASGAMSGIVGEVAGEALYGKTRFNEDGTITYSRTGMDANTTKELSGLIGGASAIFTGNAVGLSDSEVAENIYSGQGIGKNAAENNTLLVNLGTAALGAIVGGGGAAWGAYQAGGDLQDMIAVGSFGAVAGGTAGFFFNPTGVLASIGTGGTIGGVTGGVSGGFTTYAINDNSSAAEIADSALKGAIGGTIVGMTAGAFTPIGGGVAGAAIGGMTSAPIDLFFGTVNNKYQIIKPNNNIVPYEGSIFLNNSNNRYNQYLNTNTQNQGYENSYREGRAFINNLD